MKIKGLQSPGYWSPKEQQRDEYDLHGKLMAGVYIGEVLVQGR